VTSTKLVQLLPCFRIYNRLLRGERRVREASKRVELAFYCSVPNNSSVYPSYIWNSLVRSCCKTSMGGIVNRARVREPSKRAE
jgi:hypothetical protein